MRVIESRAHWWRCKYFSTVFCEIWSNKRILKKTKANCIFFLEGSCTKKDDALVTDSPGSCSNGITEPKRRNSLAMSFADKVRSFVIIY